MQIQTQPAEPTTAIEQAGSEDAPIERAETRARMVRYTPPVDIYENAEALVLVTDLPGVPSDAVELHVERGTLSLAATDAARGRVYRRAFALSDLIDPDAVDAALKDGVLTVRLGKREEMKPRRVAIRSA